MNPDTFLNELRRRQLEADTRRQFLKTCTTGMGGFFMANQLAGAATPERDPGNPLSALEPHFNPKVKRVIFLHMIGAPSQLELFDYKPELEKLDGKPCPQEFLAYYAEPIMNRIGVSTETHMFFCGMGIGYRDPDAPVNGFDRNRVPLEDHVRFQGFE